MAKDYSPSVTATEVQSDDASDHPFTRENATHTTHPELPAQWPAEPHLLAPEPMEKRWLLAYDIALCLIPLALMAKTILCIVASVIDKYNTGNSIDQVSALTYYLSKFNHQLTTIFTVVFVLIMTTLVRRLALYKAQEGATIAKLEQLQASISLPGTLKAIWSLRSFKSRTSVVLCLMWTYYYLGSQAATSEYEYRPSAASHKLPIIYFSGEKQSIFYSNHSEVKVSEMALSNLNSMYNIFSTIPSSYYGTPPVPWDLNGAALVPYLWADGSPGLLNSAPRPKLRRDRHGYYDVSKSSRLSYTSRVGLTIFALVPNQNFLNINGMQGDYSPNASYFNASCTITGKESASSFPPETNSQTQVSINMTDNANSKILGPDDAPAQFDIWARLNDTSQVIRTSCRLQQINVQMKVSCTAATCRAKRMRFQPGAVPVNRTVFDYSNFTSAFFNNLLYSNGVPTGYNVSNGGGSLATQIFSQMGDLLYQIYDPAESNGNSLALVQQNQDPGMSQYVTSMINSYYQASLDPFQGSYEDPVYNTLPYDDNVIPAGIMASPDWAHSTFEGNLYNPQYVLSILWVVLDLISCQILLAAAVFAFWLRKRTLAPDIFGYVSSLTRDNPNLNLPDGGSTMSGLERARLLRNFRVKIADVADHSGIGKVGLSYAGPLETGIQMAHLKRDRHYV